MMKAKLVLPTIVVSQFLCTSLWFAGNVAAPQIVKAHGLSPGYLAHLTSAVQAGFISGTFLFALLSISDRFSPSRVFFTCSLLGALVNFGFMASGSPMLPLASRFLTGFLLAGIYPVGMKIAADYNPQGLGKSLGYLVGALVAGTALPHLLKAIPGKLPLPYLVGTTSALSVAGGTALLLLVPDGPYRKPAQGLKPRALFTAFRSRPFRAVAGGYFGHMWELYAFWTFVPVMLQWYTKEHHVALNVPLLSFAVIGSGAIACGLSGHLSQYFPAKRIATMALALSGLCCVVSPVVLSSPYPTLVVAFLLFWGLVVIADSPMFSSLVATHADSAIKGSALTLVNCIGFAITIVSIQLVNALPEAIGQPYRYLALAAGPALGLMALLSGRKERA